MTENDTETKPIDIFTVARWFDSLWNSTARAIDWGEIEWQCNTWGSSRGNGTWEEIGLFNLVVTAFDLSTFRNYDGREELVVCVPLSKTEDIIALIDRIGEVPEDWPWLQHAYDEGVTDEEIEERMILTAAELLSMPASDLAANDGLLEVLRIRD